MTLEPEDKSVDADAGWRDFQQGFVAGMSVASLLVTFLVLLAAVFLR